MNKSLSVIIPAYNEAKTIVDVINEVLKEKTVLEVIVVDDNSSDNTAKVLRQFKDKVKIYRNETNMGKGYSVRRGARVAKGKYIIVQDADLEYSPKDFDKLLEALKANNADIINSVRDFTSDEVQTITRLGSSVIPSLVFVLFGKQIRDIVSCYKLMRLDTWKKLQLKSNRFELETEIIVKAIQQGLKIKEVEISYHPRSKKDGKHIRFIDGIKVVKLLFKFWWRKKKN